MECEEIRILLSAYLDQELDPQEIKRVEAHLEECSACRNSLDELREYIDFSGRTGRLNTPPGLKEKVWNEIDAGEGMLMAWPIRILTNKAFQAVSGLAAAALLVSYFLFTPNMLNTSHLESDFAFQEIKHGKAPAEKKGQVDIDGKTYLLLKDMINKVHGNLITNGINEYTGKTDFVTLQMKKDKYGTFMAILDSAGIDVDLPQALKKTSGYLSLRLYFPGRKFFTGDFNGDGETDLACYFWRGKNTGEWYIAYHDREAAFHDPLKVNVKDTLYEGGYSSRLIAGDVNGDGFDDIVIYQGQDWKVLINDTENSFYQHKGQHSKSIPQFEGGPFIPLCGDIDHNGYDDLVAQYVKDQKAGKWFVALNENGDTYDPVIELDVPGQIYQQGEKNFPFLLDFNGDGYDDSGIYWQSGELSAKWFIALNNKALGFDSPFQVYFGSSPRAFEGHYLPYTGDFNADGFGDLLVKNGAEDETGEWYWMKNEEGKRFSYGYHVTFGTNDNFHLDR